MSNFVATFLSFLTLVFGFNLGISAILIIEVALSMSSSLFSVKFNMVNKIQFYFVVIVSFLSKYKERCFRIS